MVRALRLQNPAFGGTEQGREPGIAVGPGDHGVDHRAHGLRLRGKHDVTAGRSNTAEFPRGTITGYRAVPGWDPVTGWGSPDAQVLVPLLAQPGGGA